MGTVRPELHVIHRLKQRSNLRLAQRVTRTNHRVAGHRREEKIESSLGHSRGAEIRELRDDVTNQALDVRPREDRRDRHHLPGGSTERLDIEAELSDQLGMSSSRPVFPRGQLELPSSSSCCWATRLAQ